MKAHFRAEKLNFVTNHERADLVKTNVIEDNDSGGGRTCLPGRTDS